MRCHNSRKVSCNPCNGDEDLDTVIRGFFDDFSNYIRRPVCRRHSEKPFDTELIKHARCRFWDKNEFKHGVIRSLDKDVLRKGTGDLAAYGELFKRLQRQEEM